MPDLFYLVSKWWKQMIAIVVIAMIIVVVVLLLKPKLYLSVTTALPASTYSADKASVFNDNIQVLYPALGGADDLDKIVGTSRLDTVYIDIAEKMDLVLIYEIHDNGSEALRKAATILKKHTKVLKSDFGELQVKVWDKDKQLAPKLANEITDKLQAIHQDVQNSNNISLIRSLQSGKERIQKSLDSLNASFKKDALGEEFSVSYETRRKALVTQLEEYDKLINEYQLLVDNKPPVLVVIERARASDKPDKPEWLPILIGSFVLSLLFSLLLALVLERSKPVQR